MKRFTTWILTPALFFAGSAAFAEKQRLKISGQILLDADYYGAFWDKDGDDSNSSAELRNGRVQIEYDFPKGWEAKVQVDTSVNSDDSDIELGSAWVRYTKWDFADLSIGKFKEPIGLERNTRSARLATIEGAMMTTAFTPGKNWGLRLNEGNKRFSWSVAAVVEDDTDDDYDEDEPTALSGRFTLSPVNSDEQVLQFGVSGSARDWNENTFQIRERAEVSGGDNVVRSAEFIADNQVVLGLEGLWRYRRLLLQGEYMATRVEELDGPDWDYDGYYISGSYMLSGEQREVRRGKLRAVKPGAKRSAWELVARYSYLDVRDQGVGSKASITTLGVNYYYGKHIKAMLAVLHPEISGSVRSEDTDGNAISGRLQYVF